MDARRRKWEAALECAYALDGSTVLVGYGVAATDATSSFTA